MTGAGLPTFGESALAAEINRICASPAFAQSRRQQQFLRYLVDRQDAGDAAALREMTVGIEFFRRPSGNYDPKRDPIVRVEARRLRDRLTRYYEEDGSASTFEIAIPIGAYAPVIRARTPSGPHAKPIAHSVAILPVANLTGDAGLDVACDAVTEELISRTMPRRFRSSHSLPRSTIRNSRAPQECTSARSNCHRATRPSARALPRA